MRPVQAKAINYLRPDIDPNTRLYVPFNEGVGSIAKDYSQYGNHAVLTDVEWGIGVNGNAGKFNGVSSFGNCGNHASLNITDAITIVARVKWDGKASGLGSIVSDTNAAHNDYFLMVCITSTNIVKASAYESGVHVIGTVNIGTGSWHHIAYTIDSVTDVRKLYVDGNFDESDSYTYRPSNYFISFIGVSGSLDSYFNGTINEVMIYNLELSAAQNAADCYEVVCNA